ncbi:LutC/YkgG family protein [Pseudomonas sp. S9]|uniref:LutC/YkgG family protein n=1 Tax=Pseudomonas sp. S9 TaxID=686578 RepID=UPI0002556ADC|nr:LUD domain-containing protein [Pseudomonas sp. S9]
MSSSRQAILSNVRKALGREADSVIEPHPFKERIALNQAGIDPYQQFLARLEVTGVTLETLADISQVPEAVAAFCTRHQLHGPLAVAPALASLPWQQTGLQTDVGTAQGHHPIGVAQAFAGIAATGSLVMLANADNPAGLNFLPEYHLVVLDKSRLLGQLDQLWPLLSRSDEGTAQAVQLITGPSSTADIGGQLLYGAHGPRAVHILLID